MEHHVCTIMMKYIMLIFWLKQDTVETIIVIHLEGKQVQIQISLCSSVERENLNQWFAT